MSDGISVPPYLRDPYPEYIPQNVEFTNVGEVVPLYHIDDKGNRDQVGVVKVMEGLTAKGWFPEKLDNMSIYYEGENTDGEHPVP